VQAAERVEAERVQRLRAAADGLAPGVRAAAEECDASAKAFAESVVAHRELVAERDALLREAGVLHGGTGWGANGAHVSAFRFQLAALGIDGHFDFAPGPVFLKPLVEVSDN
jgi:hypothetical protein